MSSEADLEFNVSANVTGTAQTNALATAVAAVGDALRGLAKDVTAAVAATDKIEKNIAGLSAAAKTDTAAVKGLSAAYKELATTAKVSSRASLVQNPAITSATFQNDTAKTQRRATLPASTALGARVSDINAQAEAEARLAAAEKAAGEAAAYQLEIQRSAAVYQNYLNENVKIAQSNYTKASSAIGTYQDKLANTRYALYGLTNTMGLFGAGLLAANLLILKQSADFQTMFANISRTTGATGSQLATLEKQFVSLGESIPVSFADLGNIATLAGQLNIPTKDISNFTKSVAEFSATTNVNVNDAATAFGRLDALLPDVKGNYEALGSSILNVGVNSVATESQIISVSSQIAASGHQAGLTAAQVIGLSASFASLGIAAESSRGTTLRVFGLINKAVATGGKSLQDFANIAGISADQFANSWGTSDFINTFQDFLAGIGSKGKTAQLSLNALGITAARDVNNILKLSQNTGLVADNLGYASDGFSKATKLSTSFAKITATLGAQLKELGNTFEAFFATLGASGLPALTGIVDGVKDAIKNFTELAANPFFQGIAGLIGVLTTVSGILLILGSAVGKTVAAMLAGRPVGDLFKKTIQSMGAALAVTKAEALAAGEEITTFTAVTRTAGVAIKEFALSAGVFAAIAVAVGFASAAVTAYNQKQEETKIANQTAAQSAKAYFTNLGSLGDAIQKDTVAHRNGAAAYDTITEKTKTSSKYTAAWAIELSNATDGQVKLSKATQETAYGVETQTFALGANTKAWYANQVVNDKVVQSVFKNASKFQAGGLNVTGFLTALAKNDTAGAKKIYDKFVGYQAIAQYTGNRPGNKTLLDPKDVTTITQLMKEYSGASSVAAKQQALLGIVSAATGTTINTQTGALESNTQATNDASTSTQTLAQSIQSAFSNTNALSSFAQDFDTLIQGIAQGGNSFSAFTQAGQTNLGNLQTSIATTIEAGQTLGLSATQSVGLLFAALQAQGVNTANLLASLANIPGVDVSGVQGYLNGTAKMSGSSKALSDIMSKLAAESHKAAQGVGSVGGSAQKAAKQVYTLTDYASDLTSTFQRASDIRFGPQNGLDKIATDWQNVADATAEANQKILDAKATLQGLVADKAIQEYFLSVANAYGDTLRAGAIQGNISSDNSQIVSAQTDLASAQDAASKSLVGNSKAAIANRATIEGLVADYQSYIEALAASGASQDTINKKTAQAKAEFMAQATALGFSGGQVKKYAASFSDMSRIISQLPRNITVSANANPALQAINEFQAKAQKSMSTAGSSAGKAYASSFTDTMAGLLKQLLDAAIPKALHNNVIPIPGEIIDGTQVYTIKGNPRVKLLKDGGYTGNVGVNDIAGMVHGQEFVVNANATAKLGLPFLNALNNGFMPTSTNAKATSSNRSAIQVVDLSAASLQFIANAVSVKLQIGQKTVATATNAANLTQANRGSN